jgi:soluble lytic murein transglycosylase
VDPFLIWAVMRRESGFHPQAHSAADARGLMQIVPSTATAIAQELALEPLDPDQLFDPPINLKLGTWYLTQLLKRFGHPALGAAAYNAGPAAVLRWLERRPNLPLDLFVELIPFKETRGYLRQVVADYFIYHQLYDRGGTAPHLSLQLPRPSPTGISF